MGIIFDIQRFSLDDGPGIRTTVFLKGCPLNCKWCHNPESKSGRPQLAFIRDRCCRCGKCSVRCPYGVHSFSDIHKLVFSNCITCGKCVESCLSGALKIYGYDMSSDEIVSIATRDMPYYRESGGGITLGGGEPLYQLGFTLDILKKAKDYNINTAVETSGYASRDSFKTIIPYTDWFLYDYKADKTLHKELTGVDNDRIVENLEYLYQNKCRIILRCPIIPGVNENEEALIKFASLYPQIVNIDRLPFNSYGKSKADSIGETMQLI